VENWETRLISIHVSVRGAQDVRETVVHDIIPTFYAQSINGDTTQLPGGRHAGIDHYSSPLSGAARGDVFADISIVENKVAKPFYQEAQFVWALKWTYIHLFGMSKSFIIVELFISATPTSNFIERPKKFLFYS
jgi:hypothetical protein